jgi:hypothetical protein
VGGMASRVGAGLELPPPSFVINLVNFYKEAVESGIVLEQTKSIDGGTQ